jgi:hypothetical protein
MSLQDIDDMHRAVAEIARVLEDGKKLALAIVHPMYSGGKFSAADGSKKIFVIKRSYFKPEVRVSHDSHDSLTVTFYREHRPLQAYVKALLAAGFTIEQLHEVTDEDETKPWHQVPMFLDILAIRRPRNEQRPERKSKHALGKRTSLGLLLTWPGTSVLSGLSGAVRAHNRRSHSLACSPLKRDALSYPRSPSVDSLPSVQRIVPRAATPWFR